MKTIEEIDDSVIIKDSSKIVIDRILPSGIKLSGVKNITNQKKHFIIYEMLNVINNKFYIGKHETYDPFDNYIGSGWMIKRAIPKYSLENFIKIILFDLESREQLKIAERKLMPASSCHCHDSQCYNLVPGGGGGFLRADGTNIKLGCRESEKTRKKKSLIGRLRKVSEQQKQQQREKMLGRKQSQETIQKRVSKNIGQKRTKEQRQRISLALVGRKISKESIEKTKRTKQLRGITQIGSSNPHYGYRKMKSLITNEVVIAKNEHQVEEYLNQNFVYTRKDRNYKLIQQIKLNYFLMIVLYY